MERTTRGWCGGAGRSWTRGGQDLVAGSGPVSTSRSASTSQDPSSTPRSSSTGSSSSPPGSTRARATAAVPTAQDAARIAVQRFGGRVGEVEQEWEHGRLEWKVELVSGGVRHDIRIDAATAAITRIDGIRDGRTGDDDSGRHGDDDHRDDHGGDDHGGDASSGHRGRG